MMSALLPNFSLFYLKSASFMTNSVGLRSAAACYMGTAAVGPQRAAVDHDSALLFVAERNFYN